MIGLAEKLEKPSTRDLSLAKKAWRPFLEHKGMHCIYNLQPVDPQRFSLDHFIPWSYVGHDELWNIIPTSASVNSAKSDHLPDMDLHLGSFCEHQFELVRFHLERGTTILLEDHFRLFNASLRDINEPAFTIRLSEEIQNCHRVARRLGFTLVHGLAYPP